MQWLSVPPLTILYPRPTSVSANTFAFLMTCWPYILKLSSKASPNAMALAAIICSNGPPCIPGKTPLSNRLLKVLSSPLLLVIPSGFGPSFPVIMTPPLGPRNVLCVVVVTTWQCGMGLFRSPFAMRPAG